MWYILWPTERWRWRRFMVSASILRLISISLLHNVVIRVHSGSAWFDCVFGSTDAPLDVRFILRIWPCAYLLSLNYMNPSCILTSLKFCFARFGWVNFGYVGLGCFGITAVNICFVFDFIPHTACTVHACALTIILPSLSLLDMIYFTADTKATPASVQGVVVDFVIDMDFASPQHCETCS
jgi:hypothetical protein